jgi:hypothetical protein
MKMIRVLLAANLEVQINIYIAKAANIFHVLVIDLIGKCFCKVSEWIRASIFIIRR